MFSHCCLRHWRDSPVISVAPVIPVKELSLDVDCPLIPFILESAWLLCKLKAEENAEGWALHRPSQAMERRAGML